MSTCSLLLEIGLLGAVKGGKTLYNTTAKGLHFFKAIRKSRLCAHAQVSVMSSALGTLNS